MNVKADSERMVGFITASSFNEAKKISNALVKKKLAACCNIVKNVTSVYTWQGKIEEAEECMIIVKTNRKLFVRLIKEVKKIHSYELPEIIGVPLTKGEEGYLAWMDANLVSMRNPLP